jgi:hypothetical protein
VLAKHHLVTQPQQQAGPGDAANAMDEAAEREKGASLAEGLFADL